MTTSSWTDRAALQRQYGSPANLATRVSLYRYLVPDPGMAVASFEAWVLDHLDWRGDEAVLDVGRGAGPTKPALAERTGGAVGLDLSPGMLAHGAALPAGRLVAGDAQRLPVADGSVDVVLAAHMLYHVPDIGLGLREARRVLRPGGAALLVANGVADKEEILALWREAADAVDPSFAWPVAPRRFSVDVDADLGLVEPAFPDLTVDMLTGRFHVDSPEPVLAWLGSLRSGTEEEIDDDVWAAVHAEMGTRLRRYIDRDGAFVVTKASGVVVAR